ncbi:MAG: hypothetical protein ACREID_00080, partial [Planctomycetota bacterium]
MRRAVALLFVACLPLGAQELEPPLLFFRAPDPKTEKRIKGELIANLNSGTRGERRKARAGLAEIGPWTVPY